MEFKKEILTTLEDYTAFNFFHNKARLILTPIVTVAAYALINITIYYLRSSYNWSLFLVGSFAVAIVIILINTSSLKKISKKQYASSKPMQVPNTVIINDTKAGDTCSFGTMMYEWQYLHKATESKKGIYLYCSKLQALIIPKRLLTPQEEKTLRQIITANLDTAKNKLKN